MSRIPQIIHNFQRQSVEGLSVSMFVLAAAGNSTYVLSILTRSLDPAFLMNSLPFLVGSGGTLLFDLIIFAQHRLLSKQHLTLNDESLGSSSETLI